MKQQSNAGSRDDEFDYMKCRKRVYRDESSNSSNNNIDKSIYVQKKRFQSHNNNQRFSAGNGRYEQDDELLIRETQAALKSLSGCWSETNNQTHRSVTEENSVYPNLFDERNETKIMSPITTTPYNSNDLVSNRDYYYLNGKPKSGVQSKKPRLGEGKFDFNELVGDPTDKLSHSSDKSEYETNSAGGEYRSVQSFSQNSAFHPPSSSMFDNKKSNSFGSMSHSAYHYTDSSGYSTYSSLDMNASSNSSPERERPFGSKPFTKDDDMSAADYKEYTTLQPAGVGSKAASVIQDVVAREGGVASVVVMNSMSNANVQNTTLTATTTATAAVGAVVTNEHRAGTFLERPMAAFSPGSTNKGIKQQLPLLLLHTK